MPRLLRQGKHGDEVKDDHEVHPALEVLDGLGILGRQRWGKVRQNGQQGVEQEQYSTCFDGPPGLPGYQMTFRILKVPYLHGRIVLLWWMTVKKRGWFLRERGALERNPRARTGAERN